MLLVTTTISEAQVLSARLAAEGVVCEVRGPSGPYPVGAAKVYVLRSDLETAHVLLDEVHQLTLAGPDGPATGRRHSPVTVAVAVIMLAVMVLGIVGGTVRALLNWL
jgi:hypothetical protein